MAMDDEQVVHLAYFDDLATLGFTQPEAFTAAVEALLATGRDGIEIAQAFAGTTGVGRRPGQFTGRFTEDESSL